MKLKYYIYFILLCFSTTFMVSSCDVNDSTPEWEWDKDKEDNADKPRFIWVDAAANFPDFANSKENIMRDLTLAKEAGFTDVVVDVRPTSGDVLFQTDVVDQVKWLGAHVPGGYKKIERTATWDYLQAFIDAGHSLGLKIHAGVNTFAGGKVTSLGPEGMLFRKPEKRDWATQLLTESGAIVNTLTHSPTTTKFFNPVNEEVQNYVVNMLEGLAAYQELDGIFLDRARFDGLNSDFSDYTKEKFEAYLGHSIENFPEDVVTADMLEGGLPSDLPVYFKQWLEFRVKVIHDFMEKAQNRVKKVNPDINFGVYVGGWYSSYYGVGVNWASPDYNTSAHYNWATSDYNNYGFADLMDIMLIGAYASPTRVYGSTEWTIQGFCSLAMERIKGDALVIGGPDVGNGAWATSSDEVVNQAIVQSVDAAMSACDGYFLFDMIHLKEANQWKYVKRGIDQATGK